jgi:flavin reductase (DIM6/NTAB) family NADH-FMN oxidoreductase RutF
MTVQRDRIHPEDLVASAEHLWAKKWFALTCGDFETGDFNSMTVAWGSMGVMWFKPFVQIVVRPTRHTFEFMERFDTFTLSAFSERHRRALKFLGEHSGRDTDKMKGSRLTPIISSRVASPSFKEAELIIECRKMYWQDMDPSHFLGSDIENYYPEKDYHRIYYGHIKAIFGTSDYQTSSS